MQLNILDAIESERRKQVGIETATNQAESVEPGWNEKADHMFREWLKGWPVGYTFLIEDFRTWSSIFGLSDPPSKRTFGAIPLRAKKKNLIRAAGLAKTKSKNQHGCFSTVWQKI